ncbi:MAG TPA: type II toxin-antitoxin system VapC family toxin [Candidatus Paceibacterota bacterium]|nr:type II toxin-antitoxin system VapC family toxin [Candidatus Paceibacterota bacterium]
MYLDSAIITKLLVREEDSEWFENNLAGEPLWSSELSLAEVHSAILIKERTGHISAAERKNAVARFQWMHDTEQLRFHPLSRLVAERAAGLLVSCHPDVALRSLDAIHVATALLYLRGSLCATDRKMRAAAQRIGLPCFPEELF